MARKPTTPQEANRKAREHARRAYRAAEHAKAILHGLDGASESRQRDALANAAKDLEAAGCYIRRVRDTVTIL